jgi:hypothetical protein
MPLDRTMSGSLLPVHHGPSQSSSVGLDQGHANAHHSGPRKSANQDATVDPGGINLQLSPQVNMTSNLSSTYLHWCVDSTPSDTLLFSLEIPTIDDTNIIKRLKHCYKSVKGARGWISLTDCEGVKFVLVRALPRLTYLQASLELHERHLTLCSSSVAFNAGLKSLLSA